jgi:hypothetical protein
VLTVALADPECEVILDDRAAAPRPWESESEERSAWSFWRSKLPQSRQHVLWLNICAVWDFS